MCKHSSVWSSHVCSHICFNHVNNSQSIQHTNWRIIVYWFPAPKHQFAIMWGHIQNSAGQNIGFFAFTLPKRRISMISSLYLLQSRGEQGTGNSGLEIYLRETIYWFFFCTVAELENSVILIYLCLHVCMLGCEKKRERLCVCVLKCVHVHVFVCPCLHLKAKTALSIPRCLNHFKINIHHGSWPYLLPVPQRPQLKGRLSVDASLDSLQTSGQSCTQ